MKLPDLDDFKKQQSGEVILPGDSTYDQVRSTFMFKGSPAMVVQPKTQEDVAKALSYAKQNTLIVSVRSGGHSASGFSTNTDGMVIDLVNINSIEIVDGANHIVKVGSGARWGDVARKLQEYQLALSSGDTKSVGVGGLTLGGGIGWMVRKYGLTIDNLVGAEIVTADGKIFHLSDHEQPDLFWAIRGGGGNFGVVTTFEFRTHPIKNVFAGMIMFARENLDVLLKGWRDYMRQGDEDLTTTLTIMPSFGGAMPGVMLTVCYVGSKAQASSVIETLKKLGTVTMENIALKPYADILEEAHPPEGISVIVKNMFVKSFRDEIIETMLKALNNNPTMLIQLRSLGGAMSRVPEHHTAFSYRSSEVMVMVPVFVPIGASQDVIKQAMKPWEMLSIFGQGGYSNFMSTTTDEDLTNIYPLHTYERLQMVKRKYDPTNLFNQNFNIKP